VTDDCIFCAIVDGEIPGHVVHETETTLAFLDANPLAEGHALIVPKAHHARIADLPADLAVDLFGVVHDLVPRVEAAVDADAVTVGVNDGPAAGQEVPHVHVHLVPRREGDGAGPIHAAFGGQTNASDEELAALADTIRSGT
jgi:histidine triad (HIT) family protein